MKARIFAVCLAAALCAIPSMAQNIPAGDDLWSTVGSGSSYVTLLAARLHHHDAQPGHHGRGCVGAVRRGRDQTDVAAGVAVGPVVVVDREQTTVARKHFPHEGLSAFEFPLALVQAGLVRHDLSEKDALLAVELTLLVRESLAADGLRTE